MSEELKVGDFITVVKWINSSDRSYTTSILEIKAINENLIYCYVYNFCDITTILDLHRVIIKKLPLDFVESCGIKIKDMNPFKAIV